MPDACVEVTNCIFLLLVYNLQVVSAGILVGQNAFHLLRLTPAHAAFSLGQSDAAQALCWMLLMCSFFHEP